MTTPLWPGNAGAPALPSRPNWQRKGIQLPFASDAGETDAPEVLWGTGNPNNVVAGSRGDRFYQTDGAGGISVWEKASGVETVTGWVRAGLENARAHRLVNSAIEIIAHRGHSSMSPENTIIAATAAAGLAHSLETDMQVSSDNVVFLMHDATVNRTTNGGNVAVSSLTAAALDALDAGTWFDATWFAGVRVPRLTDYLMATQEFAKLYYPEIKLYRTVADIALMVQPFIDLGLEERAVMYSFVFSDLVEVRKYSQKLSIGFCCQDTTAFANAVALGAVDGNATIIAEYVMLLANPGLIATARAAGLDVVAWTPSTITQIRQLLEIGVRRVFTDKLCHRLMGL